MPKSLVFVYLGREFLYGRDPKSSTIREHLCRAIYADYCVVISRAFHTREFPPRELAI